MKQLIIYLFRTIFSMIGLILPKSESKKSIITVDCAF